MTLAELRHQLERAITPDREAAENFNLAWAARAVQAAAHRHDAEQQAGRAMSGPSWQRSIDGWLPRPLGSSPKAATRPPSPAPTRCAPATPSSCRPATSSSGCSTQKAATRPSRVGDNPVRQLHHALTRLERAGDWIDDRDGATANGSRVMPPRSDARLGGQGGGMQTEIFVPALRQLPGPTAWAVLRDLNDVAGAIPYLDADLAAATARGGAAQQSTRPLRDALHHATLARATEDLSQWLQVRLQDTHIAAGRQQPQNSRSPHPAHLRYADRPPSRTALGGLAAVLMHQDSDVSIVDVRAALRALADGIDHTVYVLDRGHHEAAEVTRATRLLREAKTPITALARLTAAARTLTPMRMDVS